jgi:hypothetical protein
VGLREHRLNVRHNAFWVRHHIVIGDTQDREALRSAVSIALIVMADALIVTSAVDFDGETQFQTKEVGEIGSHWHLPAEFMAQLSSFQALPK